MSISIPKPIDELLETLARDCQNILGNAFVGFYVHGSLVMGCFNYNTSDVDFLVVASDSVQNDKKKMLIDLLIQRSDEAPPKGFEMSVVLEKYLQHFIYPTPIELHFRSDEREKYKSDPYYNTQNQVDYDLAAHATVTKQRGICVLGKPIEEVFIDVPKEYYFKSIIRDTEESIQNIADGADVGTCSVPAYGVLNLCRVLAFIDKGLITSKQEGGEWGLKHLPQKYSEIIQQALNKYAGNEKLQEVEASTLKEFAHYAKKQW